MQHNLAEWTHQTKPTFCPCLVFHWVVRNVALSFSVPQSNMWRVSLVPLLFQPLVLGLASFIKFWPCTPINFYWTKEPFLLSVTSKSPIDFIISEELLKIYHTNGHTLFIQYPFSTSLWPQKAQWVPNYSPLENEVFLICQTGWQQLQRLSCSPPFPTMWLTIPVRYLSNLLLKDFGVGLHDFFKQLSPKLPYSYNYKVILKLILNLSFQKLGDSFCLIQNGQRVKVFLCIRYSQQSSFQIFKTVTVSLVCFPSLQAEQHNFFSLSS